MAKKSNENCASNDFQEHAISPNMKSRDYINEKNGKHVFGKIKY